MDQVTLTVDVPSRLFVAFDSSSPNWSVHPDYNQVFLRGVQNHANNLKAVRGYLFVNEVLDHLGLPRTRDGQLLGWADGYVDFGLLDSRPELGDRIGLRLNIDGVIVDSI